MSLEWPACVPSDLLRNMHTVPCCAESPEGLIRSQQTPGRDSSGSNSPPGKLLDFVRSQLAVRPVSNQSIYQVS